MVAKTMPRQDVAVPAFKPRFIAMRIPLFLKMQPSMEELSFLDWGDCILSQRHKDVKNFSVDAAESIFAFIASLRLKTQDHLLEAAQTTVEEFHSKIFACFFNSNLLSSQIEFMPKDNIL
ncbi:MAG TPA: hypothetical protein VMM58_04970 [Bacteroidota bacterium]|nr:hypothetical protein [Bacteroidota bacterium]